NRDGTSAGTNNIVSNRPSARLIQIGEHDRCPFSGQRRRDRLTDAAAGAGHEGYFLTKSHTSPFPFPSQLFWRQFEIKIAAPRLYRHFLRLDLVAAQNGRENRIAREFGLEFLNLFRRQVRPILSS